MKINAEKLIENIESLKDKICEENGDLSGTVKFENLLNILRSLIQDSCE